MTRALLQTALAVSLLSLWLAAPGSAAKFPPVGVKCPEEFPEHRTDAHGTRDTCVVVGAPRCPQGFTLQADAEGEADSCSAAPETPSEAEAPRPECPKKYELEVGPGPDVCAREGKPKCRKGYKMKIIKGWDMCTRGK